MLTVAATKLRSIKATKRGIRWRILSISPLWFLTRDTNQLPDCCVVLKVFLGKSKPRPSSAISILIEQKSTNVSVPWMCNCDGPFQQWRRRTELCCRYWSESRRWQRKHCEAEKLSALSSCRRWWPQSLSRSHLLSGTQLQIFASLEDIKVIDESKFDGTLNLIIVRDSLFCLPY